MFIALPVWREVQSTLGRYPPECGGILGMKDHTITEFFFDYTAVHKNNAYFPCTDILNQKIIQWHSAGIQFCGMIHSHPKSDLRISQNDIFFARCIIQQNRTILNKVYFPIVSSTYDSEICSICTYTVTRTNLCAESTIITSNYL